MVADTDAPDDPAGDPSGAVVEYGRTMWAAVPGQSVELVHDIPGEFAEMPRQLCLIRTEQVQRHRGRPFGDEKRVVELGHADQKSDRQDAALSDNSGKAPARLALVVGRCHDVQRAVDGFPQGSRYRASISWGGAGCVHLQARVLSDSAARPPFARSRKAVACENYPDPPILNQGSDGHVAARCCRTMKSHVCRPEARCLNLLSGLVASVIG